MDKPTRLAAIKASHAAFKRQRHEDTFYRALDRRTESTATRAWSPCVAISAQPRGSFLASIQVSPVAYNDSCHATSRPWPHRTIDYNERIYAMKFARHEYGELYREMAPLGWTVEKGKRSGHHCWTYKNGARVHTSGTPSDPYAVNQARRDMQRVMKAAAPSISSFVDVKELKTSNALRPPQEKPMTQPSNKVQTPFNGIRFPTPAADKPPVVEKEPTSALYCEHANEMPATCPCPSDCYCKFNSCKSPQRHARHQPGVLKAADRPPSAERALAHAKELIAIADMPKQSFREMVIARAAAARAAVPADLILQTDCMQEYGVSGGWLKRRVKEGIITPVPLDPKFTVGGRPFRAYRRADILTLKAMEDAGEKTIERKVPGRKPAPVGLREAALALRDLCDKEHVVRVTLEKVNGKWTLETRREVVTVTAETGEL